MPTHAGPNSKGEENLVFAYDTGDVVNSYKGEPVTNLIIDNTGWRDLTATGSGAWTTYDGSTSPAHAFGVSASLDLRTDGYRENSQDFNTLTYNRFNPGGTEGPVLFSAIPIQTSGNTVTVQFKVRALDSTTVGKLIRPHLYYNYSGGAYSAGTTYTLTSNWQTVTHTHTLSNTSTNNPSIYLFCGSSGEYLFEFTQPIVHSLDHAVQYTRDSRSNTQGLLDLTGNSTLDLTNVSFDSNAQMTFDGTDDQFIINNPGVGTSFTVETIIKANDYSNSPMFISPNSVGIDHFFRINSSGIVFARFIEVADSVSDNYTSTTVLNTTDYYHVVMSKSPTNGTIYVNGIAEDSHTPTLQAVAWSGNWKIGARYNNTFWFDGEMPILKVYNRALTASEIKSNYNAIKGRFNI